MTAKKNQLGHYFIIKSSMYIMITEDHFGLYHIDDWENYRFEHYTDVSVKEAMKQFKQLIKSFWRD